MFSNQDISTYDSNSDSYENVMWEQGEDYSNKDDKCESDSPDIFDSSPSSLPPTPGLSLATSSLALSSQELPPCPFALPRTSRKKLGRPFKRRYFGNQYTAVRSDDSINTSADTSSHTPTPKKKKFILTLPRRGYTSQIKIPTKSYQRPVSLEISGKTSQKKLQTPKGMRLLDVEILAQAIRKFRCTECGDYLTLYESQGSHGWQTHFYIKCADCHHLLIHFPSSRPMNAPKDANFVNVNHPEREMNEVTMRSILVIHSSGSSWRDLHKFSTIFDMPPPLANMPQRYLQRFEPIVTNACNVSMQEAAHELHTRVDAIPSSETNCINIPVSFDNSWKTRGFYSNIGFGCVISAATRKVLDYVLLSRLCEKCDRWTQERKDANHDQYKMWYENHKPNCYRNYTGTSQAMERFAATTIWARSKERHQLVYLTFIGDGDSKSYTDVVEMNPYPTVNIVKEECIAHVTKRLKKTLMRIKRNTKEITYIHHKLSEPKAHYISSNYSTVIIQNRGKSPYAISHALSVFLAHASGDHATCPDSVNSWCRWRAAAYSGKPPPPVETHLSNKDLEKIREVFQVFGTEEFCKYVTMGLTQNANEALHNTIWNFCPKSKYISPRSIRISAAIAICVFNEGELVIYKLLDDLNLHPSSNAYESIVHREMVRKQSAALAPKKHVKRRARRAKVMKEAREKGLDKNYSSGSFGAENFKKLDKRPKSTPKRKVTTKKLSARGRGRESPIRGKSKRNRGSKWMLLSRHYVSSDESAPDLSNNSSGTESSTVCEMCDCRMPPTTRTRRISRKPEFDWLFCEMCHCWFHCECLDVLVTDYESRDFICFGCLT